MHSRREMYTTRITRWGDTTKVRPFAEELRAHFGAYQSDSKRSVRARKALKLVFDNIPADALEVIMTRKIRGVPADRAIEDFVRESVVLAAPHTAYSAVLLTTTATEYVLWCVRTKGWPLDPKLIWSVRAIDIYATTANLDKSDGTRSNYKGRLLRISEVLLPEQHPKRSTPLSRRNTPKAYTAAEMKAFRGWATQQLTDLNRDRAMLMLTLCAGAGVRPSEIPLLHHEHITVDDLGILISVPTDEPRQVPLLAEWEPWMKAVLKRRPTNERLWGPLTRRNTHNLTSAFTERSEGKPPRADRLRHTWFAHHLYIGTPLKELYRAGGVQKMQHVHLLLEDVPARDEAGYRLLLRSEGQA